MNRRIQGSLLVARTASALKAYAPLDTDTFVLAAFCYIRKFPDVDVVATKVTAYLHSVISVDVNFAMVQVLFMTINRTFT